MVPPNPEGAMDINGRHGFSIIEMAATLVVMGIIASIAVPRWGKLFPSYRLDSSTRQLKSELHSLKMRAASENVSFQLQYVEGAAEYAIQRNETTLVRKPLPEGVVITKAGNVSFFPRGTASGNRIRLRNSEGSCKQVVVSGTGRIRICKPAACAAEC
jgi:prepilin-type N-terminal cleavage/methylation domain-containing protein